MSERWSPDSWRKTPVLQVPDYPDAKALPDVVALLGQLGHHFRLRVILLNRLIVRVDLGLRFRYRGAVF